jgi:hypothetical protein
MNARLRYPIVIVFFWLHACSQSSGMVTILPEACQVKVGEQIVLALNGQIPSNASIHWEADKGKVVWVEQGLNATFTAPDTPGDAEIAASFASSTPSPAAAKLTCKVLPPEGIPSPPLNSPPPSPPLSNSTVVISEVMGHPCGGIESTEVNQYVELYNYGDQAVDVGGWWIYDEGVANEVVGTPDQLVAWNTRSAAPIGSPAVLDSTVIPPHGFALVFSFIYTQKEGLDRMPYTFPKETVILTTAASEAIGDDYFGIISTGDNRDTITLYIGGAKVIDKIMDTYGTPLVSDYHPISIEDDRLDKAPLYLSECEAAERINPRQPDSESNWVAIKGGSPGNGPYNQK